MKFKITLDGIEFEADQKQTDELIEEVSFVENLKRECSFNSQIICDSEAMITYIIDSLKEKKSRI